MECPSFSFKEESVTAYRDRSTGFSLRGALLESSEAASAHV